MTILGTRPEIIRLSAVLKCCDKYFEHCLVHSGQNWDYTLNQIFFDDLEFLSEESAILGFPGVLIRTSTERPEVLDKGNVVIGGIKARDVQQAADLALAMARNGEAPALPADYADTNVSMKVVKIIQSYTHIVNKTIWMK